VTRARCATDMIDPHWIAAGTRPGAGSVVLSQRSTEHCGPWFKAPRQVSARVWPPFETWSSCCRQAAKSDRSANGSQSTWAGLGGEERVGRRAIPGCATWARLAPTSWWVVCPAPGPGWGASSLVSGPVGPAPGPGWAPPAAAILVSKTSPGCARDHYRARSPGQRLSLPGLGH
jgi:hypothetical protein